MVYLKLSPKTPLFDWITYNSQRTNLCLKFPVSMLTNETNELYPNIFLRRQIIQLDEILNGSCQANRTITTFPQIAEQSASSIHSFLSLARPFPCLSFEYFLPWSSISALLGVERSIGVFFYSKYPFSITVLLFHFYPLKRALFKYSYSEISMFLLFHPQKGIILSWQVENFR